MVLPLFYGATLAINALGIVFFVRGLRAVTRQGVSERAAWCFLLTIVPGGLTVAFYVVSLSAAFGIAGKADPSAKARMLSEGLSTAINCSVPGVLGMLPPLIFAFVLFVRRYRYPASAGVES